MRYWISTVSGAVLLSALFAVLASPARAKPIGPSVFCDAYPDSPHCVGRQPTCELCHTTAPAHNDYGAAIAARLLPDAPRPLPDAQYAAALPEVLAAIAGADADGDGTSNLDEVALGTWPGNPSSKPSSQGCDGATQNPYYDVCNYDPTYALRKVSLDICGHSPTYAEVEAFSALPRAAQMERLDQVLDQCLDSEFWIGKNGALWQLAHEKIRPVGAFKAGEDPGFIGLSDYYDDYHLFVYAQTDDHDLRDMLTADYYVQRVSDSPTVYQRVADLPNQVVQRERRAGLMTTNWVMVYNVMFAALPRAAAAQAYRAFLGLDIARLEGLYPIAGEPVDYDNKGVSEPGCAVCHSTLDPLSYPFKNYNGFQEPYFQYFEERTETHFLGEGPRMADMPEAGAVLGQRVDDLVQWAQVAANSTELLVATVSDYWALLIGSAPAPSDAEFARTWQRLGNENAYSVERMLHDLIHTEAYGAP